MQKNKWQQAQEQASYDPDWHQEHLDVDRDIFPERDTGSVYAALEIARYLIWLAENDSEPVHPRALAALVYGGVVEGRWWSEIAEDAGLPVPPAWE